MSTLKDFITSSLSDFTTPAIRRPVEDIIYETLDRRQVPTRTDFHELRDIANGLRGQLSSSTQGIKQILEAEKDMVSRLDELEIALEHFKNTSSNNTSTSTKPSNSNPVDLSEIEEKIQDLSMRIEKNHQSISTLLQRIEGQSSEQSQSEFSDSKMEERISIMIERKFQELSQQDVQNLIPSKGIKVCLVPGCNTEIRAKGFCNPHYQQWRRKTLQGFVSIDNEVIFSNGSKAKVDKKYSAKPYAENDGTINIDNGALFVRID
jgi:hypothetical protein